MATMIRSSLTKDPGPKTSAVDRSTPQRRATEQEAPKHGPSQPKIHTAPVTEKLLTLFGETPDALYPTKPARNGSTASTSSSSTTTTTTSTTTPFTTGQEYGSPQGYSRTADGRRATWEVGTPVGDPVKVMVSASRCRRPPRPKRFQVERRCLQTTNSTNTTPTTSSAPHHRSPSQQLRQTVSRWVQSTNVMMSIVLPQAEFEEETEDARIYHIQIPATARIGKPFMFALPEGLEAIVACPSTNPGEQLRFQVSKAHIAKEQDNRKRNAKLRQEAINASKNRRNKKNKATTSKKEQQQTKKEPGRSLSFGRKKNTKKNRLSSGTTNPLGRQLKKFRSRAVACFHHSHGRRNNGQDEEIVFSEVVSGDDGATFAILGKRLLDGNEGPHHHADGQENEDPSEANETFAIV